MTNRPEEAPVGRQPDNQPLPPQNLDAEESVLGAMLLSPKAIEDVQPIVQPRDFYRESHGRIYRAALDLHAAGQPVDAITVADKLEQTGQLTEVGGKTRIHELAALVPTTSNAAHYAAIVVEMAELRGYVIVGEQVARLGWDRPGALPQLRERARELVAGLDERNVNATPIDWQTHQQILQLQLPVDRYLIDDLIPAGAVGTIAGVPETHKSWLALQIAMAVAKGTGTILGKNVHTQGPVGYAWQDDSTREEAERVKVYEDHHTSPTDTPILWALNLGLQLPRDIARLRQTVTDNHLVLLVLDSYYNFLPGIDLKDEAAEQIVSQLKQQIADTTGCTILIVDHMPWATETNRQRLRAYGGVFKNAATRFGIYIDVTGDKLHIEARGNNIRGFPKTLAYWNEDELELRLVTNDEIDRDDLYTARAALVLEWLEHHPGQHSTNEVRKNVKGGNTTIDGALEQLLADSKVRDVGRNGEPWIGKGGSTRYWIAEIHTPKAHPEPRPETLWRGDEETQNTSQETSPGEVVARFGEVESNRGFEDTENAHSDLARRGRGEVWRGTQTSPPATQDDLATGEPPIGETYRGSDGEVRTLAPDLAKNLAKTETGQLTAKAAAEEWIRTEGWMQPDPGNTLIERWPSLLTNETGQLIQLAATLAAAELGETAVEAGQAMEPKQ